MGKQLQTLFFFFFWVWENVGEQRVGRYCGQPYTSAVWSPWPKINRP